MNVLAQLKEKIEALPDKDREFLLKSYRKGDFNLMFRQAAVQTSTLDLLEFLYLHKAKFGIDVNARGVSKKGALEFAIEKNAKEIVLFLLKLKEIEVDDLIRENIKKRFGEDFRTINISPCYLSTGNKLIEMNQPLAQLTDRYTKCMDDLSTEACKVLQEILAKQKQDKNPIVSFQDYLNCLHIIDNLIKDFQREMSQLSGEYGDFEETFSRHLPYSYAQEKLLKGNEFTISNLRSSMKEVCLHDRAVFEKTIEIIQNNKHAAIGHLEQPIALFILILKNYRQIRNTPSIKPALLQIDNKAKEPKQEQQKTLSRPIVSQTASPLKLSFLSHESHKAKKVKKQIISSDNQKKPGTASIRKESDTSSIALKKRLERLQQLSDGLTQLKRKGQVKLPVFLGLIKKISKEIGLEMRHTKKGMMISKSTHRFSFHRPNRDKGVDKKAIVSIKHLVDQETSSLSQSINPAMLSAISLK